jgi:hypothetical protein
MLDVVAVGVPSPISTCAGRLGRDADLERLRAESGRRL